MSRLKRHTGNDFLVLGGFLDFLRINGFEFGPDKFIQIKHLFNALDPDTPQEKLKNILCPLFAHSAERQQLFYYLYDKYFESLAVDNTAQLAAEADTKQLKLPEPPKKRQFLLGAAGVFFGLLALLWVAFFLKQQWDNRQSTAVEQVAPPVEQPQITAGGGTAPTDTTTENPVNNPVIDADTTEVPIPIDPKPPIAENISDLEYQLTWWQRYGTAVKLSALMLLLTAFVAFRLFERKRRRYLLLQQQFKRPPDTQPLEIPNPKFALFQSDSFYNAAKALRQRDISDHVEIDIPRTIRSTVEAGGFLQLEEKPLSKPSEYLVLVELNGDRDHLSQWLKQLARDLQRQDVLMEIYFYKKDPRIVWRHVPSDWQYLEDIYFQYREYRLIILGDGAMLVNAYTGRLQAWTDLIADWEDRVLCTPLPVNRWSKREVTLEKLLKVLPATPEGISQITTAIEAYALQADPEKSVKTSRAWGWKATLPDTDIDLRDAAERAALLAALNTALGADVYEWLCACAVYPELHWDFTLELGRRLDTLDNDLLHARNLYLLACLPWFQEGSIPTPLRNDLVSALAPGCKKMVLQAILDILKRNEPSENTYAWNQYRTHRALVEWQLSDNAKQRRKLLAEARSLSGVDPEARELVTAHYADALPSPHKNIPQQLHPVVYEQGQPALGFSPYFRNFMVALAAVFALSWIYMTRVELPLAAYQDKLYILENYMDSCRYYTFLGDKTDVISEKLAYYDKALQYESRYAPAIYNRGCTWLQLDSLPVASRNFTEAIRAAVSIRTKIDTGGYLYRWIESRSRRSNDSTITVELARQMDTLISYSFYNQSVVEYRNQNLLTAVDGFLSTQPLLTTEYERGLCFLYINDISFGENAYLAQAITLFNADFTKRPAFYQTSAGMLHPLVEPLLKRYKQVKNAALKQEIAAFLLQLGVNVTTTDNTQAPPPTRTRPSGSNTSSSRTGSGNTGGGTVAGPSTTPPQPVYKTRRALRNGMAAVQNDAGLWGFVNSKGVLVIPFRYEEVSDFDAVTTEVVQDGLVFYINKQGRCVKDCPK